MSTEELEKLLQVVELDVFLQVEAAHRAAKKSVPFSQGSFSFYFLLTEAF